MMKLVTRSQGFRLTPALAAWVDDRVRHALSHRAAMLRRVDVHVGDVNGPRGGVDKDCRVVARLTGGGTVTVQRRHEDLYAAVREAALETAGRCDARADRQRAARRRSPR